MAYWLFKSEPDKWSWDQQKAKGEVGEEWDGIRNYQARNFMREMEIGDLAFFYHSNIGLEVVGIAEVCALCHPDSTTDDERWECVDIKAVCDMPMPVTLKQVKADPELKDMSLVTSMRLSVQPVTLEEWKHVCKLGGLKKVPLVKKRTKSGAKSKATAAAKSKAKAVSKPKPVGKPKAGTKSKAAPKASAKAAAKPKAKTVAKPKTKVKSKAKAASKAKAKVKVATKAKSKAKTKTKAKAKN